MAAITALGFIPVALFLRQRATTLPAATIPALSRAALSPIETPEGTQ